MATSVGRQARDHPHLDRAPAAADVRLGLTPRGPRRGGRRRPRSRTIRAGQAIITEGEEGYDIFVIRQGSMVVEKNIGGKPVFLSYLPAGSYVGEMALIDGGRRTATVKRRDQVRGDHARRRGVPPAARAQARAARPAASRHGRARSEVNDFIEARKDSFGGVVDMYSLGRRLPRRERHRRGDRRAADRREAVRRLRQLREGLRRQP